jgi:hypothetical protein
LRLLGLGAGTAVENGREKPTYRQEIGENTGPGRRKEKSAWVLGLNVINAREMGNWSTIAPRE